MEQDFSGHIHESYNIGVLTYGEVTFSIEGSTQKINRDTIYIINPEDSHSISKTGDGYYSYLVVSIRRSELQGILSGDPLIFKDKFIVDQKKAKYVAECILRILKEDNLVIERQELLLSILEQFEFTTGTNHRDKVINLRAALGYLKENFKSQVELKELADLTHLSMYHFTREFKKTFGLSPFDYLIQLRIKEAQRLLVEKIKIAAVAADTGFYDQSHLTKYFKRYVGLNPGDYLKHFQKK